VAIAYMLRNLVFTDTGSRGRVEATIDMGFGSDGARLTRAAVVGGEEGRIAVIDNSLRSANVMAGNNAMEQFRDQPFAKMTGTLSGKRGHGMTLELNVAHRSTEISIVERGLDLDKFRILDMTPLPVPANIQEEIHSFR